MSGFVAMNRDALDHPVIGEAERFRAWFWLVANACWKPTRVRIKGKVVTLERGQLSFSVRYLAESWGWSKSRVDRFLHELAAEGMIAARSKNGTTAGHPAGQGQAVLTICNYDKFQDPAERKRDNHEAQTGTTAGQQRDKEEQGNKGTRNKSENARPSFPCPEGVDPVDWSGLIANREKNRAPLTEAAHRGITNKLDAWEREGWPPGPIVAHAAELGWRTVFPTDEMKANANGRRSQSPRESTREIGERLARRLDGANDSDADRLPRLSAPGRHG